MPKKVSKKVGKKASKKATKKATKKSSKKARTKKGASRKSTTKKGASRKSTTKGATSKKGASKKKMEFWQKVCGNKECGKIIGSRTVICKHCGKKQKIKKSSEESKKGTKRNSGSPNKVSLTNTALNRSKIYSVLVREKKIIEKEMDAMDTKLAGIQDLMKSYKK